jgi:GTP-binding protein
MEIISSKYLISNADYTQCPKPNKPEYAFIGRSNVGKSSLINMLCNNSKLAKISSTPGKTQLINHFEIVSSQSSQPSGKKHEERWYLVDLPGYGYAATVSQKQRRNWSKMIEDYIRKRENLCNLFILIDGRHDPQVLDIEFINKLGEWRIPFSIVFTKTDKNKPGGTKQRIEKFFIALSSYWEEMPNYFISSSITKEGKEALLEYISELNYLFKKRN